MIRCAIKKKRPKHLSGNPAYFISRNYGNHPPLRSLISRSLIQELISIVKTATIKNLERLILILTPPLQDLNWLYE
ncbi:MAG: hypothetical protein B1H11_07330 [Desulfobacteraceae bacterium 4484_190.1]|nr:MAG: hypothetical protein B1H11_07330 [Desulfobacteraceae bacterium 4484_190.1]